MTVDEMVAEQRARVRRHWNDGWLGPGSTGRPGLHSMHRYAPDHRIVRSTQGHGHTWWQCACGEVSNFTERHGIDSADAARRWVNHVLASIPRIDWKAP